MSVVRSRKRAVSVSGRKRMRLVLVHETSNLSLTIPKKWSKVSQIIDQYCASPTGKRFGFDEDVASVRLSANGKIFGRDDAIQFKDGDLVRVVKGEEEVPKRLNFVRSATAKQLTSKAEDFSSAHDDCEWRGIRFGCYVVCDGHGGQAAAQSAKQKLLPKLLEALDGRCDTKDDASLALAKELPAAMATAFETVDAEQSSAAGTTATMVLVLPGSVAASAVAAGLADSDDEESVVPSELGNPKELDAVAADAALVVCANVGDSLAYIDDANASTPGKLARLLSYDHRLERNASEQQRCKNEGGRVDCGGDGGDSSSTKKPLRLWPGGLMMSRVIGDPDAPQASPFPEIRACLVFDGSARIVIASDGLWDELSGRAALKMAATKKQPTAAAQLLVSEARKRGNRRNDTDDIVVVVVDVEKPELFATAATEATALGGQNLSGGTLLRMWDATPNVTRTTTNGCAAAGAGLSGAALDSAVTDARRRRVAAVARAARSRAKPPLPLNQQLSWTGLAANPANFFEAKRVVGVGGFGKVLLCTHRLTGDPIAIKVMTKAVLRRKRHERRARVERDSLLALASSSLDSPLIVNLTCAWQNESAVYLAMPYIGGGDLNAALKTHGRFPEANAAFYGAQLLCALAFAHSRGVLHRDVKPENVLLDNAGHAVLIDLGLARPVPHGEDDLARTRCGTDEYWSPEMVRKEHYSTATDVWSASVLVYELLSGKSPFLPEVAQSVQKTATEEGGGKKKKKNNKASVPTQGAATTAVKSADAIHQAIVTKTLKFSPPDAFTSSAVDLLRRALDRNPLTRLGVSRLDNVSADVDGLKSHAWWRSAVSDARQLTDEAWWMALENRQISPPKPPAPLIGAKDDDDATTTMALRDANEARSFLHPSVPQNDFVSPTTAPSASSTSRGSSRASKDAAGAAGGSFQNVVAIEKSRHRARDPYDGFEHSSPADAYWSLLKHRESPRSHDALAASGELDTAPCREAVPHSSIVSTHAVVRGFVARSKARSRRQSAYVISRSLRNAVARRSLAKLARILPALRKAILGSARAATRIGFLAWCRFSTRVASARAAQQRRRAKEAAERAERAEREATAAAARVGCSDVAADVGEQIQGRKVAPSRNRRQPKKPAMHEDGTQELSLGAPQLPEVPSEQQGGIDQRRESTAKRNFQKPKRSSQKQRDEDTSSGHASSPREGPLPRGGDVEASRPRVGERGRGNASSARGRGGRGTGRSGMSNGSVEEPAKDSMKNGLEKKREKGNLEAKKREKTASLQASSPTQVVESGSSEKAKSHSNGSGDSNRQESQHKTSQERKLHPKKAKTVDGNQPQSSSSSGKDGREAKTYVSTRIHPKNGEGPHRNKVKYFALPPEPLKNHNEDREASQTKSVSTKTEVPAKTPVKDAKPTTFRGFRGRGRARGRSTSRGRGNNRAVKTEQMKTEQMKTEQVK